MATEVSAISFCFFARSNQTQLRLFFTFAIDSLVSNVCFLFFSPYLFSFLVSTHKSICETIRMCPVKPGGFPCSFPSLPGVPYPGGLWWVGQGSSGGSDAFPGHHVPFLNLFSLPQASQPHQPLTFCWALFFTMLSPWARAMMGPYKHLHQYNGRAGTGQEQATRQDTTVMTIESQGPLFHIILLLFTFFIFPLT